jgi:hypothetical protein
MAHSVHCGRCGSRRVRRSHTPPGWSQYVRRWTPLRRYACGTCGYRGWTLHPFQVTSEEREPTTARPLEVRDLRQQYARRRKILRVIALAFTLGVVLAYLILRAGGLTVSRP